MSVTPSVRKKVIERDGHACAMCGIETVERSGGIQTTTIDHVVPVSQGGADDLDNLRVLCLGCNAQKGAGLDDKTVRFQSKVEQAGYTIVPNVVLLDPTLSAGAKALYAVLRYYARQDEHCWPGQARLATQLGVTDKTLRGYIAELTEARLVAAKRRGRGTTNIYVLLALSGYFAAGQHTRDQDKNGNIYRSETGESTVVEREKLPSSSKQGKQTQRPEPASSEAGLAAAPPTDPLDQEIKRLCDLMSSEVRLAHNIPASSREARVVKGWLGACRALLTTDGYTVEQVEYAIRWVCRDHYWRVRVKSMTRLRSEMLPIVMRIREHRQNGSHLAPTDGLSPSARALQDRNNARRARIAARQQTNPPQIGEPDDQERGGARHQLSDATQRRAVAHAGTT